MPYRWESYSYGAYPFVLDFSPFARRLMPRLSVWCWSPHGHRQVVETSAHKGTVFYPRRVFLLVHIAMRLCSLPLSSGGAILCESFLR